MITLGRTLAPAETALASNYSYVLLQFGNMMSQVLGEFGDKYHMVPVDGIDAPSLESGHIQIPSELYSTASRAWNWVSGQSGVTLEFPYEPLAVTDRLPPPNANKNNLIYQWYSAALALLSPEEKKQAAINIGISRDAVAKLTARGCSLSPGEGECAKGFAPEIDNTDSVKSRWCCPEKKKPASSGGPSIGKILFVVVVTGALVAGGYFLFVRKPAPSIEKQYGPGYFPGA